MSGSDKLPDNVLYLNIELFFELLVVYRSFSIYNGDYELVFVFEETFGKVKMPTGLLFFNTVIFV